MSEVIVFLMLAVAALAATAGGLLGYAVGKEAGFRTPHRVRRAGLFG